MPSMTTSFLYEMRDLAHPLLPIRLFANFNLSLNFFHHLQIGHISQNKD